MDPNTRGPRSRRVVRSEGVSHTEPAARGARSARGHLRRRAIMLAP
jgi:hypothetical protein